LATWDARTWIADLIGCDPAELTVRSTDSYGSTETQTRYDRGGEVVARLTVSGPVRSSFDVAGDGHWAATASRIRTYQVHWPMCRSREINSRSDPNAADAAQRHNDPAVRVVCRLTPTHQEHPPDHHA
jgi:hypothetical protein